MEMNLINCRLIAIPGKNIFGEKGSNVDEVIIAAAEEPIFASCYVYDKTTRTVAKVVAVSETSVMLDVEGALVRVRREMVRMVVATSEKGLLNLPALSKDVLIDFKTGTVIVQIVRGLTVNQTVIAKAPVLDEQLVAVH